jgi:hypothetical protein
VPRQIVDLDTLGMCNMLGMTKAELIQRINKAKVYSTYKPSYNVIFCMLDDDLPHDNPSGSQYQHYHGGKCSTPKPLPGLERAALGGGLPIDNC